jgi:hypothetical protein
MGEMERGKGVLGRWAKAILKAAEKAVGDMLWSGIVLNGSGGLFKKSSGIMEFGMN